jgi:predicted MFS family arabinose efflux permease
MFSSFLFLSYYFQGVLHFSPLKAGVAFLPFPLGVITSSTIASRTLPRFGPRVLAMTGFTSATLGMLWLTQLPPHSAYWVHVVPAMLHISLGMGQVFVPLSSTALLGVPNHDAGAASALVNTMQQIGGSLGIALLNTIATSASVSFAKGHHVLPTAATAQVHGFATAFSVSVGILAFAFLVVATLIRGVPASGGAVTEGEPEHEQLHELEPALVGV